jgi:signal transduction histidine kinase
MTTRMRRIAHGDEPLGEPFPVGAQDEIGDLARAWNQLAAALREREGQLVRSERLAAVGRMAAHVTHEVRNPLSSIALNAELLEEELAGPDGTPSPEGRRLLLAIGAEVDRLTAITEEYLRFARLPRPHRADADLAEIARGVLEFARGDLATAGVALETRLEATPLEADADQLRQVLLNLLRNALEASVGGGRVLVETVVRPGPPAGVELRVTDAGAGMSDEVAARLFEPFFTTKDRGTGLGLALTQQIVLDHGGTIRAERVPAGGTAFVVWLPVAPPKQAPTPSASDGTGGSPRKAE